MAVPLQSRRWTRYEYDRLIQLGVLHEDEPIELIGGEMIVAEPKGSPHATAVGLAGDALRAAFGEGWIVRLQDPVALDDESEPEPDVAVVPGRPRDYRDAHPSRPAVVVEVAESSLAFDRHVKGSLYARAGLPDYWIVNLVDRTLEVYREPVPDPAARFGWRYGIVEIVGPEASASPLAPRPCQGAHRGRPSAAVAGPPASGRSGVRRGHLRLRRLDSGSVSWSPTTSNRWLVERRDVTRRHSGGSSSTAGPVPPNPSPPSPRPAS